MRLMGIGREEGAKDSALCTVAPRKNTNRLQKMLGKIAFRASNARGR
jgi:hypothetical protein